MVRRTLDGGGSIITNLMLLWRGVNIIAGFRYQPVGDEAGQYKQTRNNSREKLEVCSILGTVR